LSNPVIAIGFNRALTGVKIPLKSRCAYLFAGAGIRVILVV